MDVCGDDPGDGKADHHLQDETDETANYGGVEVFEGAWRVSLSAKR